MAQTLWATYDLTDPIVKGRENISPDAYEEVRLSIGGNTALVGDLIVYDSIAAGSVGATTPATHRDVMLAGHLDPDAHAAEEFLGWHGQIIRPAEIPQPTQANVDWTPDTALIDGTQIIMLKRGTPNVVTKMIFTDDSKDVLTGIGVSLSATAGEIMKTYNTFTNTTPTVQELADVLVAQVQEFVGFADAVSEDNPGQQMAVDVMWGCL